MFFKQTQTPGLGCFSYILGCPAAGVMAVVDPRRDIGEYLDFAASEGMRLTHIFETHVHADHVSGAQELRAMTGAGIYIHESAGAGYDHVAITAGDVFTLGAARIEVLHTPGHTPNSVSLLVSDLVRSDRPQMVLTGDLLFVGDVGRPDLPGELILDEQVRNLHHSLHVVLGGLPDSLEVYPAHGQGSLCGRGMSSKNMSTLGYERLANPMLQHKSLESFKAALLSALPVRPRSFSAIIAMNLEGAPLLGRCPAEQMLPPEGFAALMEQGAVVIDTRDAASFGGAHIPGSLNIGFERQMANWVGMAVPPGSEILLVVEGRERFEAMRTELQRIGYDAILGWLSGGLSSWILSGRAVASLAQVSVHELRQALDSPAATLIDVRTPAEWQAGHIAQAVHRPLAEIIERGVDFCLEGPVSVVCGSGYRSNIVGSLLKAGGCVQVRSVAGGMLAWTRSGYPVVA
ncbi:MAG: MBL fold metallo-hydrolase [Proteobacteria bacterium]|nr:MBL fold metallo-hydrolase [Pseudomonadota bacterium]MBU1594574.1 MBL fold metallo-hydrolase [Pseudomonadota bacterium]